jgi:dipeptidyl aminopeptidase/acylaminoacyl peptidase
MTKFIFLAGILFTCRLIYSQAALNYQKPPKEILDLVDVQRAPNVLMDSKKQTFVYVYTPMYMSIEQLSQPELKLAGQRINQTLNVGSGIKYIEKIAIQLNRIGEPIEVKGFPQHAQITALQWSPDEKHIACGVVTEKGMELWIIEIQTQKATKLTGAVLNANLGSAYSWFPDSKSLLVHQIPANQKSYIDAQVSVPAGPSVSTSDGSAGQNRTYPDLLKNAVDEQNFEIMASSELWKVDLMGNSSLWKPAGLHTRESFSPDGNYLLISTIQKPYSYIVPWSRFGLKTEVFTANGKVLQIIENRPVMDNIPKGFMAVENTKRAIQWRSDESSTITYVIALDGGDPKKEVPFRDEVFTWNAPFNQGTQKSLLKTPQRFAGITWGKSDVCIVYDSWYDTRNEKTYLFNPSKPGSELKVLFDRNSQDEYSNPGNFETVRNLFNRTVLQLDGMNTLLIGDGFTEKGQFPFVNQFNLESKKSKTLYRTTSTSNMEEIIAILDIKKGDLLIRQQSQTEYPNYFTRKMTGKAMPIAITNFKNPFSSILNVSKEVIRYKREDGLDLTATLYLPAGYDKAKKEKLPMVMWAYPEEFKDKSSASQNTTNPNEFVFPYYGSPIYWVTRGYAVLDKASFPIVGEGTSEPNDTFLDQLIANAKGAIDAVDKLGFIDRKRVAVGGHSYGAFMTANLLTHSNLFAAGIARSGAYNRSLTPFGFQGEERNYWEAKETYNAMAPFNFAEKMKTPLLLIHGENDNNPGTFPIQSERYFQALKGLGAPARYVVLPKESHGYSAKESVLHVLWEQDQWLELHVKNRKM